MRVSAFDFSRTRQQTIKEFSSSVLTKVNKYTDQKTSDVALNGDFVKKFALNTLENVDSEITMTVPSAVAPYELAEYYNTTVFSKFPFQLHIL